MAQVTGKAGRFVNHVAVKKRLNRRATRKREANQLVCNMMRVKDEVKRITHGLDPFFHAVLVFTSAHVEAKWGTTGKVHCIREDQIADYIVERKPDTKLSSEEIKRIKGAFLTLAQRRTDFTEQMAKEEPRAA